MTRDFDDRAVPADVVDELIDTARRVPSAGSSQGFDFLVLEGDDTQRYWDVTLPEERRVGFKWQGLLRAPVLVVVYADADRYVQRYAEPDKARTGLGESSEAWSTPYWLVDASMAALALQLAAIDRGLGVLFFGVFDHAAAVAEAFGVPSSHEVVGAIAIGHPAAATAPGRSASRPKRSLDDLIHRGRW